MKRAWETRPDLRQARLQVTNGERQVAGAANAAKPEVDVYGSYESRGVVIPGLTAIGGDPLTGNALLDSVPAGGTRSSTIYEAGIQFLLPVQNRVAKANLGADKALLRQQQIRPRAGANARKKWDFTETRSAGDRSAAALICGQIPWTGSRTTKGPNSGIEVLL